jgi:APA family basic amino acid/polyamine antiporter
MQRRHDESLSSETGRAAALGDHALPQRRLHVVHAVAVCIGMVVGAGIFKTTPLAAANLPSAEAVLLVWLFGGAMSLVGALCFAELASAFPDAGGDYNFLRRAFGDGMAFLFAWSRFAVIHTGSMAMLAFAFGDYLATAVDLGPHGATILGMVAIVTLAAVNVAGLKFGLGTQIWLLLLVIAGMLAVGFAGLWLELGAVPVQGAATASSQPTFALGAALVFVFLAYGGWSDTATLSAEMRDAERGIARALVLGMCVVTALYLLVNWAFLRGLGHAGLAASAAPAADLMRSVFGRPGQIFMVSVVAITSITSINALLIAGARTTYAAARDTAALARLGRWHGERGTPTGAIVAMATVALLLMAFGAATQGGFATMVDYLSPVYWFFLTCSGVSLLVLRQTEPDAARPFRVPAYPFVPLAFVASSAYVLYASLEFVRVGAIAGVIVLLLGAVLLAALRVAGRRRAAGS